MKDEGLVVFASVDYVAATILVVVALRTRAASCRLYARAAVGAVKRDGTNERARALATTTTAISEEASG